MSELAEKQVLRRHDKAMSVVGRVGDEDARFALLEYVLVGTAAVEAAFRPRPRRPARLAEVVKLRDEDDLTFEEIAGRLGYASDSGAWHAYNRALRSVA